VRVCFGGSLLVRDCVYAIAITGDSTFGYGIEIDGKGNRASKKTERK
jgi:hypothetical protein